MGSCASKHSNEGIKSNALRPTFVMFHNNTAQSNFQNPKVRGKIFSKKDSHTPILHLELNKFRNMRISLISSYFSIILNSHK